MLASLRSRLILASVLWTAGLLMALHLLSVVAIHHLPRFRSQAWGLPAAIAALIMVSGVVVLWFSLQPFRRLRHRLTAVRTGQDRQIAGAYPSEVQPLIDDLNQLLVQREKAVQRALTTAGDLAHGLKTPLALLRQESERAEAAGHSEIAAHIAQQVERMSRQIDYQLARARASASGATGQARCDARESAEALARALAKLYAAKSPRIVVDLPAGLCLRVQREDCDEMLGNLLDNACKWARQEIRLHAQDSVLFIDDDGPGIPAALRSTVLARGVRIDQTAPGSGLGLAIVSDLAELYCGALQLDASPAGGLRARLRLPLCAVR
jgi:signal transduction histidine kinase